MCIVALPAVAAAGASATTLANVALGAAALGGIMSAIGAYQQGQTASKVASYNAAVARNNQAIAERQAQEALARGAAEEERQRMQAARLIGSQRASLLANNLAIEDDSSASALIGDTALFAELDALTIRSNAAREADALRQQGANFAAEAQLEQAQGRYARRAGNLGSFTSLLGSAGTVASRWYSFNSGSPMVS